MPTMEAARMSNSGSSTREYEKAIPACEEWALRLPYLLYIGDVPVESSYHGSALLYRLLQNYPPQKLRIIESGPSISQTERRLPDVLYSYIPFRGVRWINTRFCRWVSSCFLLRATGRVSAIPALLNGFAPDAVLTVAHGYGWLTAARYAKTYNLPLHLIVHDDTPSTVQVLDLLRPWLHKTFRQVYQTTASRFCVSPFMAETYLARYGAEGNVLFPSRAIDSLEFDTPPERLSHNDHIFTVAFGGTINYGGCGRALRTLAKVLDSLRGQLLIFGPLNSEAAQQSGWIRPNIVLRGLVASNELVNRFRQEVDVLFVPMSFDPAHRINMEISFPSKLTDYTAAGLPLLIYGPPYCSAVRWAREHPGVAEIVDQEDENLLATAVKKLALDPEYRVRLGKVSLEKGLQYFSYLAVSGKFYESINAEACSWQPGIAP